MINLDMLILGYRVFTIEPEDLKVAVNILIKNNISAKFKENSFAVKEKYSKRIEALLLPRVKFSKSEMRGLGGFIYKNRLRVGFYIALLITISFWIFSSMVVWDIRIEGSEAGCEEQIKHELFECGFKVGSFWHKTDKSEIEVLMLEKSEFVSWININRRGTVAYVSVIDKVLHEEKEEKTGYSNIVASSDAVIEEIIVLRGVAMVRSNYDG